MTSKSIPGWVWLIPITLLLVATARLPYGYYTFTRVVVCALAALIAIATWHDSQIGRAWSVLFELVAILFNPVLPIFLKRNICFHLDVGIALVFPVHRACTTSTGTT